MNTQNNLGIWLSSKDDLSKVDRAIQRIKEDNHCIEDIFLISDDDFGDSNYTIIPSFYVSFYNFMSVFLNVNHYIANRDKLKCGTIFLLTKLDDIVNAGINKQVLNSVRVLEI